MPAAVAVPAIASLVGTGVGAIAKHKSQSNAAKQADKRLAQANMYAGQDYQNALNFQNSLTSGSGLPSQLFGQMTGPQTSTSSSNSNTVQDESGTQGLVKTPELLATRTRAAQAAGAINPTISNMLHQQYGQIGRQQEADTATTQNFLASRGGSPADVRMAMLAGPATRNANAARLAALAGAGETQFAREGALRGEQASIEQMLADTFRNSHMTSRTNQSGTNTGPGNYGAALSLLAPPQRQVFV